MLLSLHIENIAVIKSCDFDFSQGFMVLTGETGAGKSIVIDSINLLLGGKGDRELIRHGETAAMVSGLFGDLSSYTVDRLGEMGVHADEDGSILVQRTIGNDGKNKITINGRSVSLSLLKSFMPYLVSIHGQSDTQNLFNAKNHLELIDVYAGSNDLLNDYRLAFSKLESIRKEKCELLKKSREFERMKEILEYQIKDIDSANLHIGEEEELVDKKVKIKNSEKITKNSEFVFKALKGSEEANYSNEGGVGYNRYQKNIMGMWIVNELRRELCPDTPFSEIVKMAEESKYEATLDANAKELLAPESMKAAFDALADGHESVADYFRCAYKSLAQSYKQAIDELEKNIGKTYEKLYIVGGGARNEFLNRLTEEATGKKVVAFPIEATALGNLKIQMEI